MLGVAILMLAIGAGFLAFRRIHERIAGVVAIAFAVIVVLVWLIELARAHDAPSGWTYPIACCSGFDCREEASIAVRETAEGYRIVSTGEVIPYQDRRVRDSPDGLWHACWRGARFDEGRVICLFVPPRAF